jgi:hypothetical protein
MLRMPAHDRVAFNVTSHRTPQGTGWGAPSICGADVTLPNGIIEPSGGPHELIGNIQLAGSTNMIFNASATGRSTKAAGILRSASSLPTMFRFAPTGLLAARRPPRWFY